MPIPVIAAAAAGAAGTAAAGTAAAGTAAAGTAAAGTAAGAGAGSIAAGTLARTVGRGAAKYAAVKLITGGGGHHSDGGAVSPSGPSVGGPGAKSSSNYLDGGGFNDTGFSPTF